MKHRLFRWQLVSGIALALLLATRPAWSVITITEIMYHAEGDDPGLEYIEIHNETPDPMDITEYYFSSGVTFTFTERTFLDPGAYIVVCANAEKVKVKYGITNAVGDWSLDSTLASSGETIALSNPAGVVEAKVEYNDRGKWPSGADGTGHSLEIKSVYAEMDDPDNWALSGALGGSPGKPNDTSAGAIPVVINEGLLTGNSGQRWFELYNSSTAEVDLAGYHATTDRTQLTKATLAPGTVIAPRGWLVLSDTATGLDLGPDTHGRAFIALVNPAGNRVIDARIFEPDTDHVGVSEARTPDGSSLFQSAADPTPGAANKVTVNPDIVINELMYHAPDKDSKGEFIELYNRGTQPVDVGGWQLSEGVRFTLPPGTTIQPDGYLVIAKDTAYISSLYGLDAGKLIGPASNDPEAIEDFGSFADSGERVTLVDGRKNIVDTVRYFDGGEWPEWADGGGASMELIDPTQDNSNGEAWDSSDETSRTSAHEYAYDGQLSGSFTAADPPEMHILLTGAGITLVDDLKMTSRVTTINVKDTFVKFDDTWRYFKGTSEASDPTTLWREANFDDSAWLSGQAIIGFGDGDESTILDDMRRVDPVPGYACFFARKTFDVADPSTIENMVLDVEYDDGFVAYLNGVEVASGNMKPGVRNFDALATAPKEKAKESIDLTNVKNLIVAGKNVLAVQVHNQAVTSNDARWRGQLVTGNFVTAEGPNLFADGNFDADSFKSSWVIQGNHIHSGRTTDSPITGAGSLKIVATGSGDNKVNRIETSNTGLIPAPVVRTAYHISLKAKWLVGAPTILMHGSYQGSSAPSYATSIPLVTHKNFGTPGAVNSVTLRQVARTGSRNAGPVISKVRHTPALPAALETVTVQAKVVDPDGVSKVTLRYSIDTPKPIDDPLLLSVDMLDPDGDGIYSCEVPGQAARKRVVFYVTAEDSKGAAGRFPLDYISHTHPLLLDATKPLVSDPLFCVYRHDAPFTGKPQSFRFWLNQANEQYLNSRQLHSNDLVDGTFVFENQDVYYNAKIRFSGSPWARQAWTESYRMRMPVDNPLNGSIHAFNLEDHQDGGARSAKERISHYIFRWHQGQTIVPYSLQWFVQLQVNDKVNEVRELVQTPNSDFISRWFPNDDAGAFFEMDDRHVFNDQGGRADSIDGTLLYPPYGSSTLGEDKEQYRYYHRLRSDEDADDFSELIKLAKLMTQSVTPNDEFDEKVWDQVNVESFLRYWSIRMNTDDWDCWGTNRGKNCYMYRPKLDGHWYLLPWDMELTYGTVSSFMPPTVSAASSPTYGNKFSEVTRFINRPRIKRLYYGIMKDMLDKQFQSAFLLPYAQKLDAVGALNTVIAKPNGFIDQRRRSLLAAVKGVTSPQVDFVVTTNGGSPLEVENGAVTIEGKAPVEIAFIAININGQPAKTPFDVAFSNTDMLSWKITGNLPLGTSALELVGLNGDLNVVDTTTFEVTVTTPGPPSITEIDPLRVVAGEQITITGTRFKRGLKVWFGNIVVTDVVFDPTVDSTLIGAIVPAGVAEGNLEIKVENSDGFQSAPSVVRVIAQKIRFLRGDSDKSGELNLTDAIYTLRYLFQGGPAPTCLDAADADDDGVLGLTDGLVTVRFLFQGGPPPASPYPEIGQDVTVDLLNCAVGVE